jgi:hypothetical protein
MNFNHKTILNYRDYPIADPDNPLRESIVAKVQASLNDDGCAVLPNFLSDHGLSQLLAEAEARQPQTYYSPSKHCNVYLGEGDDSLPEDHPRNVFIPRTNGFITADLFDNNTISKQLYDWGPLRRFLADCLSKPELYIYDDPISNMIVNVGKPEQQFNWHFDTNEFTITMLLKSAQSGGEFEYVPGLRTQDDECYDCVKNVLDGNRERTHILELNAGDLQFFLGRYSLHQVTENTGDTDRLLLIMSFTEQPGVIGNPVRVKDLYGKLADVHQIERIRSDNLID